MNIILISHHDHVIHVNIHAAVCMVTLDKLCTVNLDFRGFYAVFFPCDFIIVY